MAESQPTYYDVLQVERHAPPERVRAAYRKLAQKYHPDKMPGNANAARAMAAINAAYEVLSDTERRAEHDRWIRRLERPATRVVVAPAIPTNMRDFLRPASSWPWFLLFGTMLLAMLTIGTAVYLTARPAQVSTSAATPCVAGKPAASCQPVRSASR